MNKFQELPIVRNCNMFAFKSLILFQITWICQLVSNFIYRSNMHSYEIGVLSEANYEYTEKRSIISLKMCILGWIYELIFNIFVIIAPIFKFKYDLPNTYFVDPITMFVVVPFLYLFNDDDTKEVIYNESWYQGIKYVLGVYAAPLQEPNGQNIVAINARRGALNQIPPLAFNNERDNLSATNGILSQQHRCQPQLFMSLPDIISGSRSIQTFKLNILRRHLSSPGNLFQGKEVPENFQTAETISMRKNNAPNGSCSSLKH